MSMTVVRVTNRTSAESHCRRSKTDCPKKIQYHDAAFMRVNRVCHRTKRTCTTVQGRGAVSYTVYLANIVTYITNNTHSMSNGQHSLYREMSLWIDIR